MSRSPSRSGGLRSLLRRLLGRRGPSSTDPKPRELTVEEAREILARELGATPPWQAKRPGGEDEAATPPGSG